MTEVFEAQSTVNQWDEDYYHPIALKLYDWAIADMLEAMDIEAGAKVLDAGCGPGVHSIRIAKAGYSVCAIDISSTMLDQARQRAMAEDVADKIEFDQKDLTQLDIPDNTFSYVFSWGVVIHIPEVEKALSELARIVKPGGKLALYVTNEAALDHRIESAARFVLRKPLNELSRLQLGEGIWYNMNDEKLWLWRFDTHKVIEYLTSRGLSLTHHRIGEFTEIQRRLGGIPRSILLHLNNLAYRLKLPAQLATTQLLIFEKR
ncbi:MAG: class I SAM-dependent methyltransferase [Spirulina sp. SIO3F2]|nr:class I SAM-dependent methyltransferase [Spirulina sp. SIO3F2]